MEKQTMNLPVLKSSRIDSVDINDSLQNYPKMYKPKHNKNSLTNWNG